MIQRRIPTLHEKPVAKALSRRLRKKPQQPVEQFIYGYSVDTSAALKTIKKVLFPFFIRKKGVKRILEVGSGTASLSIALAHAFGKGTQVIACDAQEGAIQVGMKKLALLNSSRTKEEYHRKLRQKVPNQFWADSELKRIPKRTATIRNVSFLPKKIEELDGVGADLTIANRVLNTYTRGHPEMNLPVFLHSLIENTAKGGRIVLIEQARFVSWFTESELEAAGFRIIKIRGFSGNDILAIRKK
ncbi:MAG: hypothetical protein Q7R70_01760 [Candidatus Diapherotrites archaeon]|nr:hypothetical protein [Candidatus Diapherotrites archaeon]